MPDALGILRTNLEGVADLVHFDRLVVQNAETALATVRDNLDKGGFAKNHPSFNVEGALKSVRNIGAAGSLKPTYERMHNQCVVLLVSYFESGIRDLFLERLSAALPTRQPEQLEEHKLQITVSDLLRVDTDTIATMIVEQEKGLSFQDMKSMGRAIEKYLGYLPPFDAVSKTIAYGQACRHVIVHNGANVDPKFDERTGKLKPNEFTVEPHVDSRVQFNPDQIATLSGAMMRYAERVSEATRSADVVTPQGNTTPA